MVDDQKIKAILEWEKSKTTKRLRLFLGLASYHRKFVRDFAKIAKPLSDLLKKSVPEIWDEHCYRAFRVSRPSHNLSGNGRAATSRDTGMTNRDLGASSAKPLQS